jgi:HK97 gp10 family phage protein
MTVKIEGLRELQRALQSLPEATARDVMTAVLMAHGRPIAEAAASLAPSDSGELASSIHVSTRLSPRQASMHKSADPNDVEVFVGPRALPYAHIVEFGSSQMDARPYMRPAWDGGKAAVLDGIRADLWREIARKASHG